MDIKKIKNKLKIEEIISRYIDLKPMGSNLLRGYCPFHPETKSSFTVYIDTQSYFCFGCGAWGDVINFVMKIENISFTEAINLLKND